MAKFSITWDLVQYLEIYPEMQKYEGKLSGQRRRKNTQADQFVKPVSAKLQAEFYQRSYFS